MYGWQIAFREAPVALRVRCHTTAEQSRVVYLAGRRAWEASLAADYRQHIAGLFHPCDRCGYLGNEHALWCPHHDFGGR